MMRLAASSCVALALLCGCATLTESTWQTLVVQTVQDKREVFGVGCVLSNNVGKWFVTTPARVTVRKSRGRLRVDCLKEGSGLADEYIGSKANASLWGNWLFTAGAGNLVDLNTGAGFDYPATLTIELRGPEPEPPAVPQSGATILY